MPTLTNELCNTFLYLQKLYADQLSMESIDNYALQKCKNLTYVSFGNNKLTNLESNIFEGSPNLDYISFEGNRLKTIDVSMFNPVKQLKELHLGENFLTEFPIQKFAKLANLTDLSIHSNNLSDLDEQGLVDKFPKLKKIYLQGNLFECDRLKIIIDALRKNNVELADITTIESVACVAKSLEEPVNYLMIIGVGVLLILLNILPVVGYIIWRKNC